MSAERFLDTNVLVYLFDQDAPAKATRSQELLARGDNTLSTQVLQEFYVVTTRKLRPPLPPQGALAALRRLGRVCGVVPLDAGTVLAAAQRCTDARLSFWDALIVESALGAGCRVLFSEDLQHGRVFDGRLTVHNPYLDLSDGAGRAHDAPTGRARGRVHRPRYGAGARATPSKRRT